MVILYHLVSKLSFKLILYHIVLKILCSNKLPQVVLFASFIYFGIFRSWATSNKFLFIDGFVQILMLHLFLEELLKRRREGMKVGFSKSSTGISHSFINGITPFLSQQICIVVC